MVKPLDNLFGMARRKKVAPTDTAGGPGFRSFGGFIDNNEKNTALKDEKRFLTYSDILANTSIVAAGVRYFLNLTAKAEWSFTPSDKDGSGEFAELAEALLTDDPKTPWHRIIRRAAMYRFYGFSVQEWTAMRREDGKITFKDVAPRAQRTITRWDVEESGDVLGMIQTIPQSSQEVYIPRAKTLYMVDDTLDDNPTGMGLFRHLVAPAKRLKRYEQLEGWGFETDLRGIPVGYGPFAELAKMEEAGDITAAQRLQIEKPMRDFIKGHIKGPELALLLDSAVYETKDEAARPSNAKQWEIDVIKGGNTSLPDMATAISRVNKEMARVLGVEQLLLGDDAAGSFALSKDKTNSFYLLVDGTLTELVETVIDDLLTMLWNLNGWDLELMPEVNCEAVRFQDIEQVTAALADMARAGAILEPDDPAIDAVRDLVNLPHQPERLMDLVDASLGGDDNPSGTSRRNRSTSNPEEDIPEEDGE